MASFCNLTVEEVCNWLKTQGFEASVVQMFQREKISGKMLVRFDLESLMLVLPDLGRGQAWFIIQKRDDFIKSTELQVRYTEVRSFGKSLPERYIKDSILTEHGSRIEESGPDIDDLLKPVREFKSNTSFDKTKFVSETLRFATACVNSRVNGIIYFGIENNSARVLGCEVKNTVQDLKFDLEQKIKNTFLLPKVSHIVHHCCKTPRLIDVFSEDGLNTGLFVVEVEIEPTSQIVESHFVKLAHSGRDDGLYIRKGYSTQQIRNAAEEKTYIEHTLPKLIEKRRKCDMRDSLDHNEKASALTDMFVNKEHIFTTDGVQNHDTFLILILDKADMSDSKTLEQDFEFISYIKWRIVIDLDNTGTLLKLYKSKGHHVTLYSMQRFKFESNILERLVDLTTTCWVYVNGFAEFENEAYSYDKWKETREPSVMSAVVDIFRISVDRGFIVSLFHNDTDGIMSDVCCAFSSSFSTRNMLYIAEHAKAMEVLDAKLLSKKLKSGFNKICGLPWSHVHNVFRKMCGNNDQKLDCEVPLSSGSFAQINRGKYLFEILSSNEGEQIDFDDIKKYNSLRINFYQGNLVSWENIALSDEQVDRRTRHVVKRDVFTSLYEKVQAALQNVSALSSQSEMRNVLEIHYRPGSGASTLARQVLWKFRKNYKCAVITHIHATRTRDHIEDFYIYGEEQISDIYRKPVLLLVDLAERDDELCMCLIDDLRARTRKDIKAGYYVLMHCCKSLHIKQREYDASRGVSVDQNLTSAEIKQFKEIHEDLKTELPDSKDMNKMLTFLLYVNNFDTAYVKHCVSQYLNDSNMSSWEKTILKYMALLNYYNDESPEVPIAFFDALVEGVGLTQQNIPNKFKQNSAASKWWCTLSETFKFLCSETNAYKFGTVNAFRIQHVLLAKEILDQLLKMQSQHLHEGTIEFLESVCFKSKYSHSKEPMVDAVRKMFVTRAHGDKGKMDFCKIIEEIKETSQKETGDCDKENKAFLVMKAAFDNLLKGEEKDAFLAQNISRICYKIKPLRLDLALKYADIAIQLKPNNSFLLDTKARVYSSQLSEFVSKKLSINECCKAFDLCKNAAESFQQSVDASRREDSVNDYIYIGGLEVCMQLLSILQKVFTSAKDPERLFNYLYNEDFIPDEVRVEWRDHHKFLKSLLKKIETLLCNALNNLAMMNCNNQKIQENRRVFSLKVVNECRSQYETFVRRELSHVEFRDGELKKEWNRLHFKNLGGVHWSSIFSANSKNLRIMESLMRENINLNPTDVNTFDSNGLLKVLVALSISEDYTGTRITSQEILRLCLICRSANTEDRSFPNLVLSMIMWPGEDCLVEYNHDLYKQVLEEMRLDGGRRTKKIKPSNSTTHTHKQCSSVESYTTNKSRPVSYKMATYFFLRRRPTREHHGMCNIIHIDSIKKSGDYLEPRSEFFNSEGVRQKMKKVKGVLSNKTVFAYNYQKAGRDEDFRIPVKVAYPSSDAAGEENVEFYLGFSWGGPVAYKVSSISYAN
jgi:hypothetical protein